IDNLAEINTEFDDFAPSVTLDGEEMVFTSNRPNGNTPDEVGEYDYDIYVTSFENGKWKKPVKAQGMLNTDKDEISNNLHYSGQRMLIIKKSANGDYDIY